jgi:hypothetical protein
MKSNAKGPEAQVRAYFASLPPDARRGSRRSARPLAPRRRAP